MKKILLILAAFVAATGLSAQIVEKPNPYKLVVDETNTLNEGQQVALNQKLRGYEDSTSTQILVLFVKSLNGLEPVDYAQQVGEGWGVGQKDKNNGVVVLTSIGDRKMWIHTGRGVEAELTDAFCSDVINNIMKPAYKQNDYYRGVDEATTAIMQKLAGTYKGTTGRKANWFNPLFIFIIIIIAIIVLSALRGKGGNGGGSGGSGLSSVLFWAALNTLANSSRGGGGGSSWGGSGGGSFGGGSFGGGGAGGSW